jgi:hypothetical protein
MDHDFPAELQQFIAQHIESLAQLEALLLMRAEPDREWDSAELARQLYITADMCNGWSLSWSDTDSFSAWQ